MPSSVLKYKRVKQGDVFNIRGTADQVKRIRNLINSISIRPVVRFLEDGEEKINLAAIQIKHQSVAGGGICEHPCVNLKSTLINFGSSRW